MAKENKIDTASLCLDLNPIQNNQIAYVSYSNPVMVDKTNMLIEEVIVVGIFTVILTILSLYLTIKWFDDYYEKR